MAFRLLIAGGLMFLTVGIAIGQSPAQKQAERFESMPEKSAIDQYREFVSGATQSNQTIDGGWWVPLVAEPFRECDQHLFLTLDDVILRALQYSEQVKVFRELPMIRRTAIIEADAAFDWTRYLETRWDDLNDPVGSTLTIGGSGTRYVNQQFSANAGVRRRNRAGGQLDVSQNLGWQETNSIFFEPNPQGTARLVLGYTHPLMRGSGTTYNQSLVCLAQIDSYIADDEFRRQLQSHLLEVTRAYWALYLERGVLFQKLNWYNRAQNIADQLIKREGIDAQQTQILGAQASVTARRADLLRATMAVKNAESRLRSLVNDPSLGMFDEVELVPLDIPSLVDYQADITEAMQYAVQSRPEIQQSLKQIKAGSLRLGMSRNEMLPQLDLITQTYVAGLQNDGSIGDAWGDQFRTGRPGYSLGLNYQIPIGNRAADARQMRRQLELRQLQSQYRTTLATVQLEVEVAVREIQTAGQELFAKAQAMNARALQLEAQTKRWKRLPGEDVSGSLALENLLDSQDRLAESEFEFLKSQLTYNLAQMNLKRVTGLLLRTEGILIGETREGCLPTLTLEKTGTIWESTDVEIDAEANTPTSTISIPPNRYPVRLSSDDFVDPHHPGE